MTRKILQREDLMTQMETLLAHFAAGGALTAGEAWKQYGTLRLNKWVARLNRRLPPGQSIRSELVAVRNGRGEVKRVARYWLESAY